MAVRDPDVGNMLSSGRFGMFIFRVERELKPLSRVCDLISGCDVEMLGVPRSPIHAAHKTK